MAYGDLLNDLSEKLGIVTSFYSWDVGEEIRADEESKKTICRVMGYPADNENQIQKSLEKLRAEKWENFSPYVKVATEAEINPLMLHLIVKEADQKKDLSFVLTREDGTTQGGQINLADQQLMETDTINDVVYHQYRVRIYLEVVPGYHMLSFLLDDKKIDASAQTRLIVVPRQCYVQESLLSGHKEWGIPLQLYAVRSERNWGIGDFADLANLAPMAKEWRAGIVGVNPLNALFSDDPEKASPYSASSRIFLNPLYVDVDGVPEAKDCTAYTEYKNSDRFKELYAYVKATDQVSYSHVSEMKYTALGILFDVFKAVHLNEKREPVTPRGKSFVVFCEKYAAELDDFATFEVLRQYFKSEDKSSLWWRWDKGYGSPAGEEIKAFRKKYAQSILFIKYQQFVAFEQSDAAAQAFKDAELAIGLYTDLPVSVGDESAEVWANQNLFLQDATIGSPPDMFNKNGQNWGLSAFHPRELKRTGYAHFIRIIQNVMKGSGAIRIDHGFGLMRLYLRVLHGNGAYVRYPFDDLMGIVALESMRNKCLVIAEDLGTPPENFHEQMRNYRTFSFRLFRYQKNGEHFIMPENYDRMSVITPGTHDLPTYTAFWKGLDLELAKKYAIIPAKQYKADIERRPAELGEFIQAFKEQGLPVDDAPIDQTVVPSWFIPDTYAFLSKSNSLILLARLEDMLEQDDQVNLPGTYLEYPNWRYKLPVGLEELSTDARVTAIAALVIGNRKEGK